jgi:hypothetical protein
MAKKQGNLLGYARRARRVSVLRKFMWSLVLFLPISAVAAASIVINSGSTVEFGQGSAEVVACDDAFDVEPITEFVDGEFKLDYVQVSDIDTSGCANQVLLVSVYASGNPTAIAQVSRAVSATTLNFDFSTFSPLISTSNIASVTVEQAGRVGLVPSVSAATSAIESFSFLITNYEADYLWGLSATVGSASLDASTGEVSVTGLTSGQSSTVTVSTSRPGYSSESVSVTGSARVVVSFATASETIVTTANYHNALRGWGVAIADSGERAIMGGQIAAEETSGVFVLEKSGGVWSETERLTPSDRPFATISSYSVSSNVVTATTATAHGFTSGMSVDFSGSTSPLRFVQTITSVPSSTTFTFTASTADAASTAWTGTVARESNFAYKHSIAMSSDGSRVAVGDSLSPVSGKGTGRVYVYDKVGSNWVETVVTNPASQNGFGESVAISGDGRTLLITHTQSTKLGAWVYYLDENDSWVKQSNASSSGATDSTLLPATITAANSNFGTHSAQLSEDGNTAMVSAHGEPFNSFAFFGATYVFTRSGGVWSQEARLVGSDFETYRSISVAQAAGEWGSSLSPDGTVVALGARGDNDRRGAVYIFQKSGGIWTESQKISNPNAFNVENFGAGVALSNQGNDLFIGIHRYSSNSIDTHGIVYHYVRDGSTWTYQGSIEPQTKVTLTEIGARTGQISVTADGQWLMIGNGGTSSTYRPYVIVLEGTP